jgi:hypothetical protein
MKDSDQSTDACAGSPTHAIRSAQALLDRHASTLVSKAIELAERGNVVALRLCVERILPPRKDRAVAFGLPAVESAADAERLMGLVTRAMARGEVTPSEALEIARFLDTYLKTEFAARIEKELAELRKSLRDAEPTGLRSTP